MAAQTLLDKRLETPMNVHAREMDRMDYDREESRRHLRMFERNIRIKTAVHLGDSRKAMDLLIEQERDILDDIQGDMEENADHIANSEDTRNWCALEEELAQGRMEMSA